jgi:hypothetical protein
MQISNLRCLFKIQKTGLRVLSHNISKLAQPVEASVMSFFRKGPPGYKTLGISIRIRSRPLK